MNTNETLSTLSLAVLGLLSKNPCSGYDLRKVFMETPMGVFSSSPGAIYPALKRCEKSGWIRGDIDSTTALRPRQVYHLTGTGQSLLKATLSRPVTPEDAAQKPGDLILRFAFMDDILSDEEIASFLDGYQSAMETYLETLVEIRETMPADKDSCAYLALEHGLMAYRANIGWAKNSIGIFNEKLRKQAGDKK
jgi:DNA-binding PadR family transcriptional regulator